MAGGGILDDRWKPKNNFAQVEKGGRSKIERVLWGSAEVALVSHDNGETYQGDAGEPGVIIKVINTGARGHIARLEVPEDGNMWRGKLRGSVKLAVISLHREVKRISRAGRLGRN